MAAGVGRGVISLRGHELGVRSGEDSPSEMLRVVGLEASSGLLDSQVRFLRLLFTVGNTELSSSLSLSEVNNKK